MKACHHEMKSPLSCALICCGVGSTRHEPGLFLPSIIGKRAEAKPHNGETTQGSDQAPGGRFSTCAGLRAMLGTIKAPKSQTQWCRGSTDA